MTNSTLDSIMPPPYQWKLTDDDGVDFALDLHCGGVAAKDVDNLF